MEYERTIEKRMERNVEKYVKKGVKILFFIVLGIGLALLVIYVLMRLWNWLMPELFGLPAIGYWEALGIFVLAKIFFGFGGGGSGKSGGKSKHKKKLAHKKCGLRRDFSEWQLYDEFWENEGEAAFKDYVNRKKDENGKGEHYQE